MKYYFGFLFIFLIAPFTGVSKTLNFSMEAWCPYTCQNSSKPGIAVEVVKKILFSNGYKINIEYTNWARAMKKVRTGQSDGLFDSALSYKGITHSKEKTISAQFCFFTKPDDQWKYSTKKSLNQRKIVIINNYFYGEPDLYIKNNQKSKKNIIELSGMKNVEQRRLALLYKNRADTIIEDILVFPYRNKNKNIQTLKKSGCIEPIDLHAGFSPFHPEAVTLSKIVSDGLKAMKIKGEIKKIVKKYL